MPQQASRSARRRSPSAGAPPRRVPFQRIGPVKSISGALAATGALLPPAVALNALRRPSAVRVPMLWHRLVTRSLGVATSLSGLPASGGVLFVANHLSWIDIPVIGSRLPGAFVAKAEVGSMGLVGLLADLQQTIYVTRERRQDAARQADTIRERLASGQNIILFPEGTSNDGVHILPFKSSLFAVVEGAAAQVPIQPVTIAYTGLNGLPLTRNRMLDIAWIGDKALGSHARDFMQLGRISAHIRCHPPVRRADFPDRKALARHCRAIVAAGYRELTRGQP